MCVHVKNVDNFIIYLSKDIYLKDAFQSIEYCIVTEYIRTPPDSRYLARSPQHNSRI